MLAERTLRRQTTTSTRNMHLVCSVCFNHLDELVNTLFCSTAGMVGAAKPTLINPFLSDHVEYEARGETQNFPTTPDRTAGSRAPDHTGKLSR